MTQNDWNTESHIYLHSHCWSWCYFGGINKKFESSQHQLGSLDAGIVHSNREINGMKKIHLVTDCEFKIFHILLEWLYFICLCICFHLFPFLHVRFFFLNIFHTFHTEDVLTLKVLSYWEFFGLFFKLEATLHVLFKLIERVLMKQHAVTDVLFMLPIWCRRLA